MEELLCQQYQQIWDVSPSKPSVIRQPLRAALRTTSICQLITQLTVHFVNTLSRHRLDQEIGQCPYERGYAVRRVARRAAFRSRRSFRGEHAHFVLELRNETQSGCH